MQYKPDKKSDPIGWLKWFTERQRQGAIKGNTGRTNASEIAHKAWRTKRMRAQNDNKNPSE